MITTDAIILKRIPYAEADQIVTFFGYYEGRLSGIAKSSRKSMRRFGGGLEPGTCVVLRYQARASSKLVRLEDVSVVKPILGIAKSLKRISALNRATELALTFLQDNQSSPEKFELMQEYLGVINQRDPEFKETTAYDLHWLSYSGYQPDVGRCVSCNCEPVEDASWGYAMDAGGCHCHVCRTTHSSDLQLSANSLQWMNQVIKKQNPNFDLEIKEQQGIKNFIARYLQHILGRSMKTDLYDFCR